MKTLKFIVTLVIAVFCYSNVSAQGVKIYKTDKSVVEIPYSALDSIVAYDKSEDPASKMEFVDLGLSVKWATCNIGASTPEETGFYFAWAETSPKSSYDADSYPYGYIDEEGIFHGNDLGDIAGSAKYDAAFVNWGSPARMPTKKECEELCEKCTWEWNTEGDICGMLVTGPNGNSIFLPAAGYYDGAELYYEGSEGGYWNSTPFEDDDFYACGLNFNHSLHFSGWNGRYAGQPIRPVSE